MQLNEGWEKFGEKSVVDGHNWEGAVFSGNAIETITLPRTLMKIGKDTFKDCKNLKYIYVEDGCEASLCEAGISHSVTVGPLPETMVGGLRVWNIRK